MTLLNSIHNQTQKILMCSTIIATTIIFITKDSAMANNHLVSTPQQTIIQDSLKQVSAGDLSVGYAQYGPVDGQPVILLHGWPYGIQSYTKVSKILASKGYRVYVPYARGFGSTRFISDKTPRSGEPGALAQDLIDFMNALHIQKAIIGGFDWGARTADIIAAIYPDRCTALVAVSGYLISNNKNGKKPLPPTAELAWWYQYYFATDRGEQGYKDNTLAFAKLIWQLASPKWNFDNQQFQLEANGLKNPDQVAVTINNYRYRLGLVTAEPKYRSIESKINQLPAISVPTVTLEGDANGAPHPEPATYRSKYTGKYVHHLVTGSIGHDLPKEAPLAFADAIVEAANLER